MPDRQLDAVVIGGGIAGMQCALDLADQDLQVALIEREAVIGSVFDVWMLVPGWVRGESTPQEAGVRIVDVVNHIDHICQLAGNSRHCGIGSDLDGGFGREQTPIDLQSIADVQSLVSLLADRGYSPEDIEGIMHGNWIRRLGEIWS